MTKIDIVRLRLEPMPSGVTQDELCLAWMLEVLKRNKWNRTHAAIQLGISRRSIREKIVQAMAMGIEIGKSVTRR